MSSRACCDGWARRRRARGCKWSCCRAWSPSARRWRALPLHRHSLAQRAVDGALVALAYWLAFQLRFTNGPSGYYEHLRDRTIWWVAAGTLPVLLASRVYQRSWRYSGQRDYEAVL